MNANTFYNGLLHRGAPLGRDVVECDYPCDYSVPIYLAVATEGEEIGIGSLCLEMRPPEPGEELPGGAYVHSRNVPLVIIPDVGVWIVQPVFGSARKAFDTARQLLEFTEYVLDSPGIPVHIAQFAATDDARVDLRGVDPKYFFDTFTYANLRQALAARLRTSPDPAEVTAVIDELLMFGEWFDLKAPEAGELREAAIPRWLAEVLAPERAAA